MKKYRSILFKSIIIVMLLYCFYYWIAPMLFIAFVYFVAIDFNNQTFGESKFNREIWLNPSQTTGCVRGEMYDDLVENFIKKGMTQDEILKLLGPNKGVKNYFKKNRTYCLSYDLGSCFSPGGYADLLVCTKDGIVIDYFRSNSNEGEYIERNHNVRRIR